MTREDEIVDLLGLPFDVVGKALSNITDGVVYFIGASGKIASGKDTILNEVAGKLGLTELEYIPFGLALKDELNQIFAIIRSSVCEDDAVALCMNKMETSFIHANHVVGLLYDDVISDESLTSYVKISNVRSALQYWGTTVRRGEDDLYWAKISMRDSLTSLAGGGSVFISDLRFKNELWLSTICGITSLRLNVSRGVQLERSKFRDGIILTEAMLEHPSETELDDSEFKITVDTDLLSPSEIADRVIDGLCA